MTMDPNDRIMEILHDAKRLEYRTITGKPLSVTGEVAEYEAARLLVLELTAARQAGYDATETINGTTRRPQVKGRCLLAGAKPGQRLGSIDIHKEFDAVLLVLLDESFNATEIWEAERDAVITTLTAPGSRARKRTRSNERQQIQSDRHTTMVKNELLPKLMSHVTTNDHGEPKPRGWERHAAARINGHRHQREDSDRDGRETAPSVTSEPRKLPCMDI